KMLESDGMFFIEAKQGGLALQVNPNNPLEVEVPAVDNEADTTMNLFNGVPDSLNNNNIVWRPNNLPVTRRPGAYVFQWYSFWFCNIDSFYDPNSCSKDLEIILPANYEPSLTSIMIIFEDVHADSSTYLTYGNKFANYYCLPLNKPLKVLCVTIID